MNWQTILAKIGACEPPLDQMVRASADRAGTVDRRAFLQICGATVAGLAIDPETLIWTPGETTIILPSSPVLFDDFIRLWGVAKKGDVVTWGYSYEAVAIADRTLHRLHPWYQFFGVVAEDSCENRVWVRTETPRAYTAPFRIQS